MEFVSACPVTRCHSAPALHRHFDTPVRRTFPVMSAMPASMEFTFADEDNSAQQYDLISARTAAQIEALIATPIATNAAALTAQVKKSHAILRRFWGIRYRSPHDFALVRDLEAVEESRDEQAARANAAENRLAVMTRLADRLATLETAATTLPLNRRGAVKAREPEEYTGVQPDLKRFKTRLSFVLADEGRFHDEQHRLRYCFSLLKGVHTPPWSLLSVPLVSISTARLLLSPKSPAFLATRIRTPLLMSWTSSSKESGISPATILTSSGQSTS